MCQWSSVTGVCKGNEDLNLRESKHIGYINLSIDEVGNVSGDTTIHPTTEEADRRASENRVARARVEYALGRYDN